MVFSTEYKDSLALVLTFLGLVSQITTLVVVPFNTTHYFGPDGPWQDISLIPNNLSGGFNQYLVPRRRISAHQPLSALLWGGAALFAPNTVACKGTTTGDCGLGGTLPPLPSNRTEPESYLLPWDEPSAGGYALSYDGNKTYMTVYLENEISFSNGTVSVCDTALYTYPNGVQIPSSVGLVGLGGNNINVHTDAAQAFVNSVYSQNDAYSLHIGAATLGYPGSLIFGGYDRGRVIGPVVTFNPYTQLRLLDLVIDTEIGESPFDFGSKAGLLSTDGSSPEPLSTFTLPQVPYIFLPSEVVQTIADLISVRVLSSGGYYLWDTSDSRYASIMSSAAYLGFVFSRTSGAVGNGTIKVPFALLSMTLDRSITGLGADAPYLPIVGSDADYFPFRQDGTSCLGRAFMQAAFTGTNWEQNVSWLAQAPGPGANSQGLGFLPVDLLGYGDYSGRFVE